MFGRLVARAILKSAKLKEHGSRNVRSGDDMSRIFLSGFFGSTKLHMKLAMSSLPASKLPCLEYIASEKICASAYVQRTLASFAI